MAVAFGSLDEWCLLGARAVAGRSLVAVGGFTGQVLFTHFKPGVCTCIDDRHLEWVGSWWQPSNCRGIDFGGTTRIDFLFLCRGRSGE